MMISEKKPMKLNEGSAFGNVHLNAIIRRLATFCKERSINLYKNFAKFDVNANFTLHPAQWEDALGPLNLPPKLVTETEKRTIFDYFKTLDGKINYLEFCKAIDSAAFNFDLPDSELARKLKYQNVLTLKGWLPFDIEEDSLFYDLMTSISGFCCKNGYNMTEYAEDTDKTSSFPTGKISVEHFSKILYKAGIYLKPVEFSVIVKKFIDYNYMVNFKLFCECMKNLEDEGREPKGHPNYSDLLYRKDKAKRSDVRGSEPAVDLLGYNENDHSLTRFVYLNEDIKTLLFRVQDHLYRYWIRDFTIYFKDKDPFDTGKVSSGAFLNVLNSMGIATGTLGNSKFTEEEMNKLIVFYSDNDANDMVLWKEFYKDVTSIWCFRVGVTNTNEDIVLGCDTGSFFGFQSINPRGTKFNHLKLKDRLEFENLIYYDKTEMTHNKIIKQLISQFDHENNGHMLMSRFRSAMHITGRNYTNREMELLEAKYYDEYGFNYRKYLDDIRRASEIVKPLSVITSVDKDEKPIGKSLSKLAEDVTCLADEELPNFDDIMIKIRYIIQPYNTELWQFLNQFNKTPNRYIIEKMPFSSAMQTAGVQLDEKEIEVIFRRYKFETISGNFMDYKTFYLDFERLDRISSGYPLQFYPPEQIEYDTLNKRMTIEELRELEKIIAMTADKVNESSLSQLSSIRKRYMSFDNFVKELVTTLDVDMLTAKQQLILFKAFAKPFGNALAINFENFERHLRTIKSTTREQPERQYLMYVNNRKSKLEGTSIISSEPRVQCVCKPNISLKY